MKKLVLLTALLGLNRLLFAQSPPCATDQILQLKELADSNYAYQHTVHQQIVNRYRQQKGLADQFWYDYHQQHDSSGGALQGLMGGSGSGCRNARYVIPVVIHVVHDPAHTTPGTGSNISNAQIQNQLDALNDAYANVNGGPSSVNTEIQFCLATDVPGGTGILRHADAATHHFYHQYDSLFAVYNQDESRYLNIYVVSDFKDSSGVTLSSLDGYGLLPFEPGRHGVTVRYPKFGNDSSCMSCNLDTSSRGKILVHEVGHFLGLYHPFEKACDGIDSSDCHKRGDLCCDVPQSSHEIYSCGSTNTCTETYNGDPNDMLENYMGYAPESCINTFTADQVSIMHATLEGKRIGLITPENQELADMQCCLFSANFIADNVFLCGADSVRFQAIKYSGASYHWRIVKDTSTDHYYDTTGRLSTYLSDTGIYHVSLTITIGTDSQWVERYQYIEVKDCGSTLASTQGNWYFGDGAGLKFTNSSVVRDNNAFGPPKTINTYQGCISQSNEHGNLLFYGGGGPDGGVDRDSFFLYNKDHQKMLNGTVYGDGSSESGGIVVPYPGDGTKYYLFTTSGDITNYKNGMHYHVIDTTLDNGKGAVVSNMKNIPVPVPSGSVGNYTDSAFWSMEGITAIPKCSGTGYWIITVDVGDGSSNYNHFVIFSVDTNGVTVHKVSNTEAFIGFVPAQLKASPDGTKISFQGDIFKFDRAAGDLELIYHNELIVYGNSFSPNSKIAYFMEDLNGSSTCNLVQLDLENLDDSSAKKYVEQLDIGAFNQLQLGPDGKIYMANRGMDQLGVIEYPDSIISNLNANKCGFILYGPKLKTGNIGGESKWGLPNMVDALPMSQIPVTISTIQKNCDSVFFSSTEFCSVSYYWDFGDGDTSSLPEPSHHYLKDSTYQVVFISDRGTDTLLLQIGLDTPLITGDTVACDTSGLISYGIENELDNVIYSWGITGGTLYYPPSTPNTVNVKWDSNGTLSVTAYDPKSGCSNSGQKSIVIPDVSNNSITADQIVCPNDTPDLLLGTVPTVNTSYGYEWQSRTPSGTWQPVADGDSQNYQPSVMTNDSLYYRRVIEISTCDFVSNEVLIRPAVLGNTINTPGTSCVGGSPLTIQGDSASSTTGSFSYLWQYSPDSMNWYDMGTADTLIDLEVSDLDSAMWYRRKVITTACTSYSNAVKLIPGPVILDDLSTVAICGPGPETHSFPIFIEGSGTGVQLEFDHYKEISPGFWGWVNGSLTSYPDSFPTSVNDGDSVKIRIARGVCEQYSHTVPVTRVVLTPDPLNPSNPYPLNMTITQDYMTTLRGTPTFVSLELGDSNSWLAYAGNEDEFIQWQKCHSLVYGGYTPWEDIPGANNDTLFLSGDYCDEGNYRAVLRGYWHHTNSCIDFVSPDFAQLTIDEFLWSKDGAADTAAEPNQDPNRDFWNSPDLWNCWKSTNCSTHESPEFKTSGYNQIRTTIRNTDTHSSDSFRVFLYWTLGGFYEKWPISWHNDTVTNGFYNPNYGQTFKMGSEIDSLDLPGLPGGTSVTVSALWEPPYPGWYDTSSYYNADELKHPLCILSRIVTCGEDPYGMTINEIEATGDNVINNNNIVTRNTEVQDSLGQNKKSPVYVLRMGNQSSNGPQKLRVGLENIISNYWSLGYFTVRFSGNIYDAWRDGGQSGSNYSLTGDEFKITRDSFYLDHIVLDSDEWGWMYIQFHLHPGVSITTYQGTQLFRFVQSSCDTTSDLYEADGGFNFLLNLLPEIYTPVEMMVPEDKEKAAGQNGELTWVQQETPGVDPSENPVSTDAVKTTAIAYPNPTSGIIHFDLTLEAKRTISIEIFDGLGKLVTKMPEKAYVSGKHTLTLDGNHLAPGAYLAKISVNGQVKIITIVITR